VDLEPAGAVQPRDVICKADKLGRKPKLRRGRRKARRRRRRSALRI
jgi:hypothetical protein